MVDQRDGKTVMLTRGRSPQDYYFALQHPRTIAVGNDLIRDSRATRRCTPDRVLGGRRLGERLVPHLSGSTASWATDLRALHLNATGLSPSRKADLVRPGGAPSPLGTAGPDGEITPPQLVGARPLVRAGGSWSSAAPIHQLRHR